MSGKRDAPGALDLRKQSREQELLIKPKLIVRSSKSYLGAPDGALGAPKSNRLLQMSDGYSRGGGAGVMARKKVKVALTRRAEGMSAAADAARGVREQERAEKVKYQQEAAARISGQVDEEEGQPEKLLWAKAKAAAHAAARRPAGAASARRKRRGSLASEGGDEMAQAQQGSKIAPADVTRGAAPSFEGFGDHPKVGKRRRPGQEASGVSLAAAVAEATEKTCIGLGTVDRGGENLRVRGRLRGGDAQSRQDWALRVAAEISRAEEHEKQGDGRDESVLGESSAVACLPAEETVAAKASAEPVSMEAAALKKDDGQRDGLQAMQGAPLPGDVGGFDGDRGRKRKECNKKQQPKKTGDSAAVSDNFVRTDLRNRGSCRFKSKNGGKGKGRFGGRFQASQGKGNFQRKGGRSDKAWPGQIDAGTGERVVQQPREPRSLGGLDPLDHCLEALSHVQGEGEGEGATTQQLKQPANKREEEELLRRLAPKCPRHQRGAKLLTVKKSGGNRGRRFYACSFPRGEGCGFFMWVEDNPALVLSEINMEETIGMWRSRQGQEWKKRFSKLTVPELKKELKKRGLPVAGKKDHLLERLEQHTVQHIGGMGEDEGGVSAEDAVGVDGVDSEVSEDESVGSCSSSDFEFDFEDDAQLELELPEYAVESKHSEAEALGSCDREEKAEKEEETTVTVDQEDLSKLTPLGALQKVFRHESFRPGQEWAIKRVLAGKPTLLVQATGSGKSLVYQLPALLLPGLTIVISPLVSLMEDQLSKLPPQLPGASLSGSHGSLREVAQTVRDLKAGRIKVLFLSPEKLCSASFRRLASTPGILPDISLICIDEAHCASQWSHNFRPTYLRLRRELAALNPRTVLALTATASRVVVGDVCQATGIPDEGLYIGSWVRPNLSVAVECVQSEHNKREVLTRLLGAAPYSSGSLIVYVWQQNTASAVAALLQGAGHSAVAYHGGMDAGSRMRAQAAFMRGRFRVVVATVAFGLGVDMSNIRGVIHYDMPKSIENYVQEIGRAGRDGRQANCHLLLCKSDFIAHHSLSHSNGLVAAQVRGLLREVFAERSPEQSQRALSKADLESRLDMKGSVVETILTVLSQEEFGLLNLHGELDDNVLVHFRKTPATALAKTEPAVAMLLSVGKNEEAAGPGYGFRQGSCLCSLVSMAEVWGRPLSDVVKALHSLQLRGEIEYKLDRRSFHVTVLRDIGTAELEELQGRVCKLMAASEEQEVKKVEAVFRAMASVAEESSAVVARHEKDCFGKRSRDSEAAEGKACKRRKDSRNGKGTAKGEEEEEDGDEDTSEQQTMNPLESLINAYFKEATTDKFETAMHAIEDGKATLPHDQLTEKASKMLLRDASVLLSDPSFRGLGSSGLHGEGLQAAAHSWLLKDGAMLARAVTRIFHGIGSACFPAAKWRESPFWKRYREYDFSQVMKALSQSWT